MNAQAESIKALDELFDAQEKLTKALIKGTLFKLYEEIKHGDEDHQKWLKDKIQEFIDREL